MPLSKNALILIERFHKYLCFYYADGHYEIKDVQIQQFMKKRSGYKNPIFVDDYQLYPTKNIHDDHCLWVNLDYYEKHNDYLLHLLEHFQIQDHVYKMYLKHKKTSF